MCADFMLFIIPCLLLGFALGLPLSMGGYVREGRAGYTGSLFFDNQLWLQAFWPGVSGCEIPLPGRIGRLFFLLLCLQ